MPCLFQTTCPHHWGLGYLGFRAVVQIKIASILPQWPILHVSDLPEGILKQPGTSSIMHGSEWDGANYQPISVLRLNLHRETWSLDCQLDNRLEHPWQLFDLQSNNSTIYIGLPWLYADASQQAADISGIQVLRHRISFIPQLVVHINAKLQVLNILWVRLLRSSFAHDILRWFKPVSHSFGHLRLGLLNEHHIHLALHIDLES